MAYTGIYERTIFYNPVNKYSVISVKTSDRSIPEKARSAYRHRDNMIHFAAVGYELPRTDQVSMILEGEWKEGKNGFQLHVTKCEEVVPQTREGIKGYLSSRLIKGIGGRTAELIVDRFGADTLHVLENEPERLLEIRGVSKAKLEEIIASYNESRTLRDLMLLLAPFRSPLPPPRRSMTILARKVWTSCGIIPLSSARYPVSASSAWTRLCERTTGPSIHLCASAVRYLPHWKAQRVMAVICIWRRSSFTKMLCRF